MRVRRGGDAENRQVRRLDRRCGSWSLHPSTSRFVPEQLLPHLYEDCSCSDAGIACLFIARSVIDSLRLYTPLSSISPPGLKPILSQSASLSSHQGGNPRPANTMSRPLILSLVILAL